MNVSLKNIDATKGIVKLEIVKADYADKVEKSLRSFRQKAEMPGFRKGMVPMGMVKKMYGKHVLVEEINKLVSENLYNYIRENKLNILGEPLPNETEQKEINFDTQEDFEFCFDVALAPEIKIELSKNDKVPYYQVNIDDEMIGKQVEAYQANFGTYDQVEDVEEKDLVKGTVAELENGSPKEGGIVVEEAVLMPMYIKDEAEKAKFIGAKKNSVIVFNPNKAYEGAEAEIASFLKVNKEAVSGITGDFSFEITEVTRHKNAELNQELFDNVFGEGTVSSEEEFRAKIKEGIAKQFESDSDYKFLIDVREYLVNKIGKLEFPDALLKRIMLLNNEEKGEAFVAENYDKSIEELTWHLIKEQLLKNNEIKVEQADVMNMAKEATRIQFAQYGMLNIPEEVLETYAKEMLKKQESVEGLVNRAAESKLSAALKAKATLNHKTVSMEEFNKMFE